MKNNIILMLILSVAGTPILCMERLYKQHPKTTKALLAVTGLAGAGYLGYRGYQWHCDKKRIACEEKKQNLNNRIELMCKNDLKLLSQKTEALQAEMHDLYSSLNNRVIRKDILRPLQGICTKFSSDCKATDGQRAQFSLLTSMIKKLFEENRRFDEIRKKYREERKRYSCEREFEAGFMSNPYPSITFRPLFRDVETLHVFDYAMRDNLLKVCASDPVRYHPLIKQLTILLNKHIPGKK